MAAGLAFAALLLVIALVASSGDVGGTTGPNGTLALRRLLHERGVTVRDADRPPTTRATFLVLRDLRDEASDAQLLAWAARTGGRLVVADPASTVVSLLHVARTGRIGGILGSTDLAPACVAPEATGVRRLVVTVSDSALGTGRAGALRCYGGSHGAFELSIPHGSGRVVLLGGGSPLTNALLASADDAAFAVGLLSGPWPVVFGSPLGAGPQPQGHVWPLLPTGAKTVVFGICLIAVGFAVVRGRRLGRPVDERPLSPIPAGELVRATADLYRVAGDRAHAGGLLRAALIDRLARRAGLPPRSDVGQVVAATASSPDERARLERALASGDPGNDDALIALGRELEEQADRAGTGGRW